MMNWEEKIEELENKKNRVSTLQTIYEKVKTEMEWNSMEWHDADEEHDGTWYTAPSEESWKYSEYAVYQEVLEMIEKMAK